MSEQLHYFSFSDLSLLPQLSMMIQDIPVRPCFALMLAFSEPLTKVYATCMLAIHVTPDHHHSPHLFFHLPILWWNFHGKFVTHFILISYYNAFLLAIMLSWIGFHYLLSVVTAHFCLLSVITIHLDGTICWEKNKFLNSIALKGSSIALIIHII